MNAALVVLVALGFLAVVCIVWPLTCAQPAPDETTVEQHADDIIAQLERPDLDMRWSSLDDAQVDRWRRAGL